MCSSDLRLFSAYVIVDWSAAAKPTTGADSVWIGVLKRDVRFRLTFESFNPATRNEAEAKLAVILDDLKKRGERALVGFDFPLGFPRGFSQALNLPGETPWRAVWDQLAKMVKDKADNTNNRFGVGSEINRRLTGGPFPFWGCPPKDALTTLQPKRPREHGADDLPEFRYADEAAKGAHSIWKLYYNGSVGGQAIVGNVESREGGVQPNQEEQPHAKQIAHAPQPEVWSPNTAREPVPVASDAERSLPDARRNIARGTEGE